MPLLFWDNIFWGGGINKGTNTVYKTLLDFTELILKKLFQFSIIINTHKTFYSIYFTDVAWFRGPTLLEDEADGSIEILRFKDRHILRLYDVQKSGFYSCTAMNAYGEASHQFRLSVRKSTLLLYVQKLAKIRIYLTPYVPYVLKFFLTA